jgi:hypothetical protein
VLRVAAALDVWRTFTHAFDRARRRSCGKFGPCGQRGVSPPVRSGAAALFALKSMPLREDERRGQPQPPRLLAAADENRDDPVDRAPKHGIPFRNEGPVGKAVCHLLERGPSKADEPASPAPAAAPEADGRGPTRRHPLSGALKGLLRVMPETNLTEPADPALGVTKARGSLEQ